MLNKSDYFFLAAALISFVFSIILWSAVDREAGLFVAAWVPAILGIGVYLKVIGGIWAAGHLARNAVQVARPTAAASNGAKSASAPRRIDHVAPRKVDEFSQPLT